MSNKRTPELFNVVTVPLIGKNLVEASAGTGKTYSLAVMALRLLVEKGYATSEILMVTFTEKAVAELQLRVRDFIRKAYKYTNNTSIEIDPILKQIIDCAPKAKENLDQAILELDQLNIFTIHSFCQQTLTSYAFQTNEAFGNTLVPDLSDYYQRFVQTYLRETLYHLTEQQIAELNHAFSDIYNISIYTNLLKESKQCTIHNFDQLISYYTHNILNNNPKVNSKLQALQANPAYQIIYDMLQQMTTDSRLQESLKKANCMSFDDLIINLSNNITPALIALFKTKYRALFIDEFQDTDALQYKIFFEAFQCQTVFYIGDPKQSIYKFRNADIHTYFKAKSDVDHLYTLPKNYRSAPPLVHAVNHLFDDNRSQSGDNAFCFALDNAQIVHSPIESVKTCKDYLTYNQNTISVPFYVNQVEKDNYNVANDIVSFLTHALHNNNKILPNQIAFIARTNGELLALKKDLADRKVPAVILQEEKIFQTEESRFILDVLKAIQSRSIKHISQVIGHRLFNIELNQLPQIEYTSYIELFYAYNERIQTKGIYEVLMRFYADFNLQNLIDQNIMKNIQFWANLNQIAEQLQQVQTQDKLNLDDIIVKIEHNALGLDDSYQTRVESDEKAVQLLTIHKSKGLEFDYIFTGNLNMGNNTRVNGIFKYYDPLTQSYIADLSLENIGYYNNYFQKSEEQEKQRVLYVLLTRAKYGIFCYSETKSKGGSFDSFLNNSSQDIIKYNFPFIYSQNCYSTIQEEITFIKDINLTIPDRDYKKISYSYLSGPFQYYQVTNSTCDNTIYDKFIFEDLSKGVITGNLIHNLFEYIDFTNQEQWSKVIDKSILHFAPNKIELYKEALLDFLKHVMQGLISIGDTTLQLGKVSNSNKINELEFDFTIDKLELTKIHQLQNKGVQINYLDPTNYHGIFNGLIDLIVEWEGKYYILDWKTNHIGNQTSDYTTDKIQEAMTAHNYHLQYCIYTVALTKYLRSKLSDFDYDKHIGGVIYLFVRGMRAQESTGVYTNQFSKEDVVLLEDIFN